MKSRESVADSAASDKRATSRSGDRVEQRAERMSAQAMAWPSWGAPTCALCGESCSCGTRPPRPPSPLADALPPGSGASLPGPVRDDFEPRFGTSFADVRIHDGGAAADRADALRAHAFTIGSEIVFGAGRFTPETSDGRRLLAHELAHVVQGAEGPPIRRFGDPEFEKEVGEERDADVDVGSFTFELGDVRDGSAVRGPLAPGTQIDDHGLIVTQEDAHTTTIDLGDHRIAIRAHDDFQKYMFWVEPLALPTGENPEPTPFDTGGGLAGGSFALTLAWPVAQPRVQRVVRIAATTGVHVDTPDYNDDERPELVAHTRWTSLPDRVSAMSEMVVSPWVREMALDGGAMQLTLDDTRIRISPPGSERGFENNEYDFASPRFAYFLDPMWTGPMRDEKIVYVVASPGVKVEEGGLSYDIAVPDYGRRLVPIVIRVPHPSMVPEQGTEINPDDYIGDRPLRGVEATAPDTFALSPALSEPPSLRAIAGLSGGVTIAHESGAMISIRPVDPDQGAAFAYQAIPDDHWGTSVVRIVVGPGVFIEVIEPVTEEGLPESFQDAGVGFRRAGLEFDIVELNYAAEVPPQGLPLNMDYYYGLGRYRKPDNHRWMETSTLAYDVSTGVFEGMVGFIPIVGDLADFAHFGYALATGRDIWGHELTTADKIVMGIGAVIGLIPIFGDLAKMGLRAAVKGSRVTLDLVQAAAKIGATPEMAEVLLHRLSKVTSGADADAVGRVNTAFRTGSDIDPADIDKISDVLRRLGAGESMLAGSRYGRQVGLVIMDEADEAAKLGRRAPEVDDWYRGLNRETRELLHADPSLAKAYEGMDDSVRRLLTRCGSACISKQVPTPAQQARLLAVAKATSLQPGSFAERQVRTYFQLRRADLEGALTAFEKNTDPASLAAFLSKEVAHADSVLLKWPGLRVRATARTAVDDAIAAGIDPEQLGKIMDSSRAAGIAGGRTLEYAKQLGTLRKANVPGVDEVLGDMARGHNWARGAEWMLRYCDAKGWKGITGFEIPQMTSFGALREIDVMFGTTRYQFKSWSTFYPSTFVRQMEKDFDLVSGNLAKLRWAFDPRKALRDPNAIIAAAETALDDAVMRGTIRLSQKDVDAIKLSLPTIIEVPP